MSNLVISLDVSRLGRLVRADLRWQGDAPERDYERPDDQGLALWQVAVEETRALLDGTWGDAA
jgi:hypothetical protein